MYIGPWQEYRLAKIQDDVIQKLRSEWEAQLRGQVPSGNGDRIRKLMQPLVAKLPSLLLAAKLKSNSNTETRNRRLVGSHSNLPLGATNRCSSQPLSAKSSGASITRSSNGAREADDTKMRELNQDLIESRARRKPLRPKQKENKAQITALEQVQKRKKMFATWIKQASNGNNDTPGQATQAVKPEAKADRNPSIRLPSIHPVAPVGPVTLLRVPDTLPLLVLPVLKKLDVSTIECLDNELLHQPASVFPLISASIPVAAIDLDESVNEEEVNNLLNWTDNLLSPQASDSLCDFDN